MSMLETNTHGKARQQTRLKIDVFAYACIISTVTEHKS
uniref:Uncharacterized protein n=1 Tax=Arundo donax TaxID=35708 RepID=A0A0A9ACJ5_ARUDO